MTDALVVARSARGKSKVLVAYVTMTDGGALMTSDWFDYLRPVLPHYMIPNVYMELDALPQTPAGKIDRRALPDPFLQRPSMEEKGDYSGDPIEAAIGQIWAQVLDVEQVGANEHFIDLGGESIEALRIAALANSQGIRFTTKELFEFPTVAALSKVATTTAELGAAVTPESISFAETFPWAMCRKATRTIRAFRSKIRIRQLSSQAWRAWPHGRDSRSSAGPKYCRSISSCSTR